MLGVDGSFESGGSPYGKNTGTCQVDESQGTIFIDSDTGEGDDSQWSTSFKGNSMVWRGIVFGKTGKQPAGICKSGVIKKNLPEITMSTFPQLETRRLLLRKIQEEDIDNVYKGLSDPAVIKHYGVSFQSFEDTKEQMEWFAGLEKSKTGIWWAVCSKDNQVFYGAGGLNDLSREHKKAEIGFWLLTDFWGMGIMKEAIPLILDYGFNQLNLHRIEGFVESNNENSKRTLIKLNFNHEGTMKDCEIKNGEFISLDIYAKLNPNG